MATTAYNEMAEVSNLVFVGVSPEYQGQDDLVTPISAAEAVKRLLQKELVFPALKVYAFGDGCPPKGEPAGACIMEGLRNDSILEADRLRKSFNLRKLSISFATNEGTGIGFHAVTPLALEAAAVLWQQSASQEQGRAGFFVNCGIADFGKVRIISGEASPSNISDLQKWSKAVQAITGRLELVPQFTQVATYFL